MQLGSNADLSADKYNVTLLLLLLLLQCGCLYAAADPGTASTT
jgi:hypothetical protein